MVAFGTKFIEFKEELLPKCIPAVVKEYWYPPKDEEDGPSTSTNDDAVVEEG